MGTSLAPNYANLFMDRFETKVLAGFHLKPLIWLKLIDDVFMIWTLDEDSLNEFTPYLNYIHRTINSAQNEFSPESIN